uniref:CCDC93 coiled-coil domain-containing protein n=1 Tax=Paramoeba aestuarina TaxID=180227 RepID=A0A7S4N5E4_9EUKA
MEEQQQKKIDELMEKMDAFEADQSKVSGARVGDILNFQSSELMQVVQMHQEEHEKIRAQLEEVMSAEDFSELQHKRQMEKRAQKMAKLQERMEEIAEEYTTTKEELEEVFTALEKHKNLNQRIVEEIDRLNALETPENSADLKTLKALVSLNESLKQQEKDFRQSCQKERKRLQELLANDKLTAEDEEELQRIEMIEQTYKDDCERLNQMRSLNAKKTRDIVMVKRKIDEIPSRTESTQYQQALLDLYEQVDAKLNETRQYYSTYNTLSNTLEFWHSEVQLMESISGNYKTAMKNDKTKEMFVKQLEEKLTIVEGNIKKANDKLMNEKTTLDEVKRKYGALLEKERAYYKATKDFQEECALNERLQEE